MVIIKLNQSPIRIGNRSLNKGDIFSDSEVIHWSSSKQKMLARPKSGGGPIQFFAEAFKQKSRHDISIKQYIEYSRKTNNPSTLDTGELYLQRSESSDKFPEKRIALIVGNSLYGLLGRNLICPINDAEDVTSTLNELGFDTYTLYDATSAEMHSALMKFSNVASAEEYEVALFYFCGHGSQNDDKNYLLPVNARNDALSDTATWISFDAVFESLSETGCKAKLAYLDACRNSPRWHTQNVTTPLNQYNTMGTLVVYSTANNSVALGEQEEEARNTPFGAAFLESVIKPAENVSLTNNSISELVSQRTEYYRQYGESPQQVNLFGVGNVDFTFVKGVNVEALLNKSKYYLAKDNPGMAIVQLNKLKLSYSYLDSIQQNEFKSLVSAINEKMLCSRVYLSEIMDTSMCHKFDYNGLFTGNTIFKPVITYDEYGNDYNSFVYKAPNKNNIEDSIRLYIPTSYENSIKTIIPNNNFHYFAFISSMDFEKIDRNKWILEYHQTVDDWDHSHFNDTIYTFNIDENGNSNESKQFIVGWPSDYVMDNNIENENDDWIIQYDSLALYGRIAGIFICATNNCELLNAIEIERDFIKLDQYPVALNCDGTKLLYSDYQSIWMADFISKQKNLVIKRYDHSLDSVLCQYSENDKYFFVHIINNGEIIVYDTETINEVYTFNYENCDSVYWKNNDIVIKCKDNLYIWQVYESNSLYLFKVPEFAIDVAISDDKEYVAAITIGGGIYIYNIKASDYFIEDVFLQSPFCIEFAPDNHSIWALSRLHEIKVFNCLTHQICRIKDDEIVLTDMFGGIGFSQDLSLCYVFTKGLRDVLKIYDLKTLKEVEYDAEMIAHIFKRNIVEEDRLMDEVNAVCDLYFENNDKLSRLYHMIFEKSPQVFSIKYSRDKSLLVEGWSDGTIKVINTRFPSGFIDLMDSDINEGI